VELTIGVDVGGTKIAAGVVDAAGRILEKVRISTPASTAETVEAGIVEAVRRLKGRHRIAAVGLAVAGFVDEKRSLLRFAPNLPMADRPLRAIVEPEVGLPVVVENDANAAAWGEYRFGGGRGVTDVVLITVGTGLGGGTVLEGRLLRGAKGKGLRELQDECRATRTHADPAPAATRARIHAQRSYRTWTDPDGAVWAKGDLTTFWLWLGTIIARLAVSAVGVLLLHESFNGGALWLGLGVTLGTQLATVLARGPRLPTAA